VKKEIDCQVFGDQLDALLGGSLPDEGMGQLQVHALTCPDCAMLLRVQEHLAFPSLGDMEAAVPEELLASVWPLTKDVVKEGKKDGLGGVPAGTPPPPRFSWLIPTLAAASVVLLLSTGFLFSELRRTQAEGTELAEELGDLREEMDELGARTEWIERTARLAGTRKSRALDYVLEGEESITLGAVVELLGRYPADMVLFEASQVEGLLETFIRPPPELRDLFGILANGIRISGELREVRAGDLAQWIETSGLPSDMVVPKSPLFELLS